MTASNLKIRQQYKLSAYKFNTSDYIVMDMKVKRDTATGRLIEKKAAQKEKQKEIA